MSPRSRVWGACRALAVGARPVAAKPTPFLHTVRLPRSRPYSDDASNQPPKPSDGLSRSAQSGNDGKGAQAASIPKADGIAAEDIAEQISHEFDPEDEAVSHDSHIDALSDSQLEQMLYGGRTVASETQGGLTPAQEEVLYKEGSILPPDEAEALVATEETTELKTSNVDTLANPGLKFPLPTQPYPEGFNLKKRYHPVLEQITRLLMRDGKLSVAQRNMAMVMNYLRTAPAPIYSPKYPLLPGTPPASHLSLNPILYMTIAVDSVAPLIKVRYISGAGGGGRSLELPQPLGVRQRRRTAFMWILDVVNKKPSKGSGRKQFPHRIAEEIIAVVEGRSSVWEKRTILHKLGTASRANIGSSKLRVSKRA